MNSTDVAEDAYVWFSGARSLYEELAKRLEALLQDILRAEGIPVHSISGRAKALDSYKVKASQAKYDDPRAQIKDMAGIRVITYVESDAKNVAEALERYFSIDPHHSDNAALRLGTDRVGYRSIHYVCTLTPARCELPEYKPFSGLEFEIQVRTILQHAWAEIEHDRNYKFAGVLPEDLRRRFMVLAGVLELADREFGAIAFAIEEHAREIGVRTESGQLDVALDTPTLREYLSTRFGDEIVEGRLAPVFNGGETEVQEELEAFGIVTLADLDGLFPASLDLSSLHSNFLGLLRDAMIIRDADRYFADAWKGHWRAIKIKGSLLSQNGVDVQNLVDAHGLMVPKGERTGTPSVAVDPTPRPTPRRRRGRFDS